MSRTPITFILVALTLAPAVFLTIFIQTNLHEAPPPPAYWLVCWVSLAGWSVGCAFAARELFEHGYRIASVMLVITATGLAADGLTGLFFVAPDLHWLFRSALVPWTGITAYAVYLLLQRPAVIASVPVPLTPLRPSTGAAAIPQVIEIEARDFTPPDPAALSHLSHVALPSPRDHDRRINAESLAASRNPEKVR